MSRGFDPALAEACGTMGSVSSLGELLALGAAACLRATGSASVLAVLCSGDDGGQQACLAEEGGTRAIALEVIPEFFSDSPRREGGVTAAAVGLSAAHGPVDVLALPIAGDVGARGWLCLIDPPRDDAEPVARMLGAQMRLAHDHFLLRRAALATEWRYQTLVEQLPGVIYYRPLDTPGVPSFVSPQVEEILGYTPEELLGDPDFFRARIHPDDRALVVARQGTFDPGATRRPIRGEYRLRRKDGSYVWVHNYALAVRDDQDGPRFVLGVLFDVSEAKRAEEERQKSERMLRRLFESNVIGIVRCDAGGRLEEANDAFATMVGRSREELVGLPWDELTAPEDQATYRDKAQELLEAGTCTPSGVELVHRDAHRVPVLFGAARMSDDRADIIAFVVDASRERELEKQLRHGQKMEAIGRLAGGVAHDFNNALSVILSLGALVLEQLRPEDGAHADVQEMVRAAERARSLTSQLLAASRRQVLRPEVIDLGAFVRKMEPMLRRMLGEDVVLEVKSEPVMARVDPAQLETVIFNLAANARDAMPTGGRLRLAASSARIDTSGGPTPPGRYAALEIEDSGEGMDAATRARIFEPFFTTKPMGKGSGLGLATVLGIVEQSGGVITCESESGRGTSFRMLLPEARARPRSRQPAAPPEASPPPARGAETVLLVEDDASVRRVTATILKRLGYQVIEASCADEASARAAAFDGPIHALLSDVVMPQMSGRELARRLERSRDGLKVLFMSGYARDTALRNGEAIDEGAFLQKPFGARELAAKLRALLDS